MRQALRYRPHRGSFTIGGQDLFIDRVRVCTSATAGILESPVAPQTLGRASLIRLKQT